ncbi:hypothetical protein, partial [Klebsiella pneumoniae]|uniref:hypothetical protein n=1 Tax=Klebsiella pneumoniae TaxID=573 RepID=UPI003A87A166
MFGRKSATSEVPASNGGAEKPKAPANKRDPLDPLGKLNPLPPFTPTAAWTPTAKLPAFWRA